MANEAATVQKKHSTFERLNEFTSVTGRHTLPAPRINWVVDGAGSAGKTVNPVGSPGSTGGCRERTLSICMASSMEVVLFDCFGAGSTVSVTFVASAAQAQVDAVAALQQVMGYRRPWNNAVSLSETNRQESRLQLHPSTTVCFYLATHGHALASQILIPVSLPIQLPNSATMAASRVHSPNA
jgi:hypothetical protein